MSDWSAGYVSDIDYTYGYYDDLNPARIKLAFLKAGLVAPPITTACELGFGQGMSVNIHAVAGTTQWYGTDFNPAQAAFAKELAAVSGSGAALDDQSFEEFCNRQDLPDFDYIALHGIWTWISDSNRAVLVDFVRRKLKVGGVVYISYNTLPGWSAFIPLRNLMDEHIRQQGQAQPLGERIRAALAFAQGLLDLNPIYARAHPSIAERLKKLTEQSPEYLAHEYFNRDWHPMDFLKMNDWLEPAKLSYACSATYSEHVNGLTLSPEQVTFLNTIPNRLLRENTRDLIINQQFRRDYWVKGRRELSALDQAEALRKQRLVLTRPAQDIDFKVKSVAGEVSLNEDIYKPIVEAMKDHSVLSVAEIESRVKDAGINIAQLFEALFVLVGAGHAGPALDTAQSKAALKASRSLNSHLQGFARSHTNNNYLACPVTGGGLVVNRFEQIFLLALADGKKTAADLAQYTWAVLALQGQLVQKEGKALQTAEENLAELAIAAEKFLSQRLSLLKMLQIV